MKLFRYVDAKETLLGTRVSWSLRSGYEPLFFTVYSSPNGKEWTLEENRVVTNEVQLYHKSRGRNNYFRVHCQTVDGKSEFSDSAPAQLLDRTAKIVWEEIRYREQVWASGGRITPADMWILMRRDAGKNCPDCLGGGASRACADNIKPDCPICMGTGIESGYYRWPVKEKMWIVSPKSPRPEGPPSIPRDIENQTFRSTFDGVLRVGDLLVTGNSIYDIVDLNVAASVAGMAAVYQVVCKKLAPKEPRYDILLDYIYASLSEEAQKEEGGADADAVCRP